MTKIIGISGRKQAGKNTVANFINGRVLKTMNMIDDFIINKYGQLEIKTKDQNGLGGWGVFDVTRKDLSYVNYAERELWPYIKVYHFADCLKQLCIDLFDLNPKQVYGTDNDKNTQTQYNGMTARQFLQYFGTDVMRKIKDDIWVSATIKKIVSEGSEIALIPDVRFPNEVKAIHENGGTVIRLTRDIYTDNHPCECALDESNFDWKKFDYVIDNNGSINDMCTDLSSIQELWSVSC
tara:strand:- start:1037 stop:1747 length:711 start_codon:yes stop_codon:yes gene_type:complete